MGWLLAMSWLASGTKLLVASSAADWDSHLRVPFLINGLTFNTSMLRLGHLASESLALERCLTMSLKLNCVNVYGHITIPNTFLLHWIRIQYQYAAARASSIRVTGTRTLPDDVSQTQLRKRIWAYHHFKYLPLHWIRIQYQYAATQASSIRVTGTRMLPDDVSQTQLRKCIWAQAYHHSQYLPFALNSYSIPVCCSPGI